MNKEKLIENWDDLKDETKVKILELADKEIKEEYFVSKMREKYYIACLYCKGIDYSYFYNRYEDKWNMEIGNVFRTPEEAIFYGGCDYYTKRFETYVNRHSEKLDWCNPKQLKYYAFYNTDNIEIWYAYICMYKQQGTTYASSEQILKDAIADIGEENFLKYVMKVERQVERNKQE